MKLSAWALALHELRVKSEPRNGHSCEARTSEIHRGGAGAERHSKTWKVLTEPVGPLEGGVTVRNIKPHEEMKQDQGVSRFHFENKETSGPRNDAAP